MENKFVNDVRDFMVKFNQYIGDNPSIPNNATVALRNALIYEEFDEFRDAAYNGDIEGVADAIIDLLYVVIGAGLAYGLPIERLWDEVHVSNMEKIGGAIRDDGKILKPEGWKPPDIKTILYSTRKRNA